MNPRDHNGFMECQLCAAQPGSPILCDSCYNNRKEIEKLRSTLISCRRWMNDRIGNTWEAHDAINPVLWDEMDELLGKLK